MDKLLLILLFLPSVALAQNCQRFWDYKKPIQAIPFNVKHRKVPSYVKSFRALFAHTPRIKRAHIAYKTKRIRPLGVKGAYGWDKSLAAYRTAEQLELSKIFALGVDRSSFGDIKLMEGDIEFHYRLAREHNCLNRKAARRKKQYPLGQKWTAFDGVEALR